MTKGSNLFALWAPSRPCPGPNYMLTPLSDKVHDGTNGCAHRSFRTIESVAYVVRVLRHCSHNGFPVVRGWPGDSEDDMEDESQVPGAGVAEGGDRGTASREGPLEGVILCSQLMVLLANRVRDFFRPHPHPPERWGPHMTFHSTPSWIR